jgi:hypothetical protein
MCYKSRRRSFYLRTQAGGLVRLLRGVAFHTRRRKVLLPMDLLVKVQFLERKTPIWRSRMPKTRQKDAARFL